MILKLAFVISWQDNYVERKAVRKAVRFDGYIKK